MKFLKALTQKKLAKAVVCGLVLSGGMFAGMGQAFAAPAEGTAYITGATKDTYGDWAGTAGTEVKITAEGPGGEKNYSAGAIYGNVAGNNIVTMEGCTVGAVYGSGDGSNNTLNISGGTFENFVKSSIMGDNNIINMH